MNYGVYLPNFEPYGKARIIADLARDAESSGWDGLFIWDDLDNPRAELVDPWVALAAAAMQTSRIRLGALITPLARRKPWKFARETVSIDHLSEGRLVVGIGAGGGDLWANFPEPYDPNRRGEMLDEAIQVVTGLWSGQLFRFDGKYYQVKDTRFLPTPYQRPRIPIWVGGIWPNKRPLRRMAQWDGMFPLFFKARSTDEAFNQFNEAVTIVKGLRQADTPFDVISLGATPSEPDEASRNTVRAYATAGATWWLEAIDPARMTISGAEHWSFEQLRARVLAGPPRL